MEFLKKLLPQEDKFFKGMRALSAEARQGAVLLKRFIDTDPANRVEIGAQIAAAKAQSKHLLSQMTRDVALSFITPFDREDIQEFAANLYKITKTIDKIRERLDLHAVKSDRGDFSRQIDLIVAEADVMEEIVEALTHKGGAKIIVQKVSVLHELENNGDIVLGELLVHLFRDVSDARDLMLRKDIHDMLEKVLDRYRDAAAIALQIVLKHS